MITSFTKEKKRLLNAPSEESDHVPYDYGFTGPKFLGIEPNVIDNDFVPNNPTDVPVGTDLNKHQSKYLQDANTFEFDG